MALAKCRSSCFGLNVFWNNKNSKAEMISIHILNEWVFETSAVYREIFIENY